MEKRYVEVNKEKTELTVSFEELDILKDGLRALREAKQSEQADILRANDSPPSNIPDYQTLANDIHKIMTLEGDFGL